MHSAAYIAALGLSNTVFSFCIQDTFLFPARPSARPSSRSTTLFRHLHSLAEVKSHTRYISQHGSHKCTELCAPCLIGRCTASLWPARKVPNPERHLHTWRLPNWNRSSHRNSRPRMAYWNWLPSAYWWTLPRLQEGRLGPRQAH